MRKQKLLSILLALILALSLCAPALAADAGKLTRGAFITELYRLSGAAEEAPDTHFPDVPAGGELAKAVCWAVDSGVVRGYADGTFRPDAPVTREQMAVMLYRNAEALGQAPVGEWMFPLGFLDTDEISPYAEEAVEWAVMNRILLGTGREFEPRATATRTQLARVLDRWSVFAETDGGSRGVIVLYTADVHCGVADGFGYGGLQEIRQALRAQGYDVILADGGDSIQGASLGTMTRGEALTGLMNDMGYDVAAPGNHEFDYGMEQFLSLSEKTEFPYVSCNFNYKGELIFEPYTILEAAGRKIAFVGITTPQTHTSSTPGYFMDENGEFVYGFFGDPTGEDLYRTVQGTVDDARADGADYVIALAHLGSDEACEPWTYEDVITHTRGIDVLLDGHSHDTAQVTVKNADGKPVPRSATGTQLERVGWCLIAPDGGVSTGLYAWYRDVSAPELLKIDNDMVRSVAAASEKLNEKLGEVVAHSGVTLTISDPVALDSSGKPVRMVRRAETNLGDLCADAYRQQGGADIAFINGGGIRVDIPEGDITLEDILKVHPYGNALCVIEVTGQQILDALEWGARYVPGENGGFLQVSGLTYEIHSYVPSPCVADENGMFLRVEGERRVRNVLVNGEPVDARRTYTLAGHDYLLLSAGDGFAVFEGAKLLQDRVKIDNQMLIDYITDTLGGEIGPDYADPRGQGRIAVFESAP